MGQVNTRAAAATASLPVPDGTEMAGYGARTGTVSGVLRPLEVNTVALSIDDVTAVVLSLDLVAVDGAWVRLLRRRLAHRLRIRPDLVLVAASHTHSGPVGFRLPRPAGSALGQYRNVRRLALLVTERAVFAAVNDLAPAHLVVGCGKAPPTVAANRRKPAEAVDQTLVTLRVERLDGSALALLWSFACHPTVLGPDNDRLSPDLPGEVRALVRNAEDGNLPVLYLNGAAGDVSTRFTRRDQSPAELQRLADIIYTALPAATDNIGLSPLRATHSRCRLKAQPNDREQVMGQLARAEQMMAQAVEAQLDPASLRVRQVAVEGLRKQLERLDRGRFRQHSYDAEQQAIRLGGLAFVTFPGELYSAQGRHVRETSPLPVTVPVGYANDYLGYLPPESASEGYEVTSAVVAPGAGDVLAQHALALLKQVGI